MASQRAAASEVSVFNLPGTSGLDDLALVDLAAPESFSPAVSIASLVIGGNLVAFVTTKHQLYLMDLRQPPAQNDSPRIVQALRSQKVKSVSCGRSHLVAITEGGAAFRLEVGSGAHLDAGRGVALASPAAKLIPLHLPGRADVVSCGEAHVLISTDAGAVCAFGDGSKGQLGLGHSASKEIPTRVSGLENHRVKGVAAGRVHSCAISNFGSLFTWGDNRLGQLGDGSTQSKWTPHFLRSLDDVSFVVAYNGTAAICSNGSSYTWGFGKWQDPIEAFDRPVGRLALSKHVLCGVSLGGELLLRGTSGHSSRVFLVQRGVAEVAAADSHVVSLGGPHPVLALPSPRASHSQSLPQASHSPAEMFPSHLHNQHHHNQHHHNQLHNHHHHRQHNQHHHNFANNQHHHSFAPISRKGTTPFRQEIEELEAANMQLSAKFDEVHAEFFFEMSNIQRTEDAIAQRSVEALVAFERDRTELSKADNVVQLMKLRDELEALQHELESEDDCFMDGHSSDTVDSITRDWTEKCAQLNVEHLRLCEDREAIQNEIIRVRTRLTENGQRLQRIEDSCVRTGAIVDRRRGYMESMQQEVSQAEAELRRAEARLPLVADEGFRLAQVARNTRSEGLKLECVECQQERDEWCEKLVDLQKLLEVQRQENHEFLSDARHYTQEHANEERSLTEQRLQCSRLERDVDCLRAEHSQAQKQVSNLHQSSSRSQRDNHFSLQRANLTNVVSQLAEKLARANAEHADQSRYLLERANKFAEETAPLYSEVQRLHAALTNLRKNAFPL